MPRSHPSRPSRPSRPSLVAAALAAAALLASAACGGDDDISRDTFLSDLEERTTIPEAVAECITDAVFEEYGQEDVNEIYRADDEEDLGEERLATLNEINQRCWGEAESDDGDPGDPDEAESDDGDPGEAEEPTTTEG